VSCDHAIPLIATFRSAAASHYQERHAPTRRAGETAMELIAFVMLTALVLNLVKELAPDRW
jgi:hypothetical protein